MEGNEWGVLVLSIYFAKFGEILSHYGSERLDEAVRLKANRVQALVEDRGLVSRDGFDHMLVAVSGFVDQESAHHWVETLNGQLHTRYRLDGGLRKPRVCIGADFLLKEADTIHEAILHAREAVHSVPESGYCFYSGTSDSLVRKQDHFSARLSEALENNRIELVYQPVYDIESGRPYTFEALARWQDAELGRVSPGEFIPFAEADPRLSRLFSRQVLLQACQAARDWNQDRRQPVSVNVNIAGPEFQQPDFLAEVEYALETTGLPPGQLVVELTEQSFVANIREVSNTLMRLQEMGVQCALDDFGTGYSSLSYLRNIPFHTLKIDRAFVDDIADNHAAFRLLRGIVNIGKALDMTIVAEGIETSAQQQILTKAGCDSLQGYLLGRPMAFAKVMELLAADQGQSAKVPIRSLSQSLPSVLPNVSTQFHGRMFECQILLPKYILPGWLMKVAPRRAPSLAALVVQTRHSVPTPGPSAPWCFTDPGSGRPDAPERTAPLPSHPRWPSPA
ncbi:MAG: EAL domain-containing protein [Oleiphilaceae bacterium]|nr:EAL domain-containing protein [Oleiphilaceae bacterium]